VITKKDIEFLAKRIRLNRKKTSLLCEEESDLNLIIDGITKKKPVNKSDLTGLSFLLYSKLVVFSVTSRLDYSITEKATIAKFLYDLFPRMQNRTNFAPLIRYITADPTEKGGWYYLMISALFSDKVNIKDNPATQIKYIQASLKNKYPDISKHAKEWILLLRKIKSDGFLEVSIDADIPEILERRKLFLKDRLLPQAP